MPTRLLSASAQALISLIQPCMSSSDSAATSIVPPSWKIRRKTCCSSAGGRSVVNKFIRTRSKDKQYFSYMYVIKLHTNRKLNPSSVYHRYLLNEIFSFDTWCTPLLTHSYPCHFDCSLL